MLIERGPGVSGAMCGKSCDYLEPPIMAPGS